MELFSNVNKPNELDNPELIEKANLYFQDPFTAKIKKEYILLDSVKKKAEPKPAQESNGKETTNENLLKSVPLTESNGEANEENCEKNGKKHLLSVSEEPANKAKKPKYGKREPAAAKICPYLAKCTGCNFGDSCKYSHDLDTWIKNKGPNIGERCHIFQTYGFCTYGLSCRFSSDHILKKEDGTYENKKLNDEESVYPIYNILNSDLKSKLWKRKYDFSKSTKILQKVDNYCKTNNLCFLKYHNTKGTVEIKKDESGNAVVDRKLEDNNGNANDKIGCVLDEELIKLRAVERKKIDWKDKLYLAPLTTVGNLPFRRINKEFGADITCSEMTMCTNILSGQVSEWALLKRHKSEDLFGVQLAGSYPDVFTKSTQIIQEHLKVDFIDINSGCPIDLLFEKGGGCALMQRLDHFQKIIRSMDAVSSVPITVKIRTGIKEDVFIAHDIIPEMKNWGVDLITLHGRTRNQRYSKLADWNYIEKCAKLSNPVPLFGCGDILSFQDYNNHIKDTDISGAMIARGALYKPWIFTEIKEQRDWDISASERFEMLKKYANYGLEHWGSDTQGIETTRRFMLEWLSFLYRYIPVGILETLPQCMNHRPPAFFCRNELETIMASPQCSDWIKITEWFLGPVPDNFTFTPKHKANAY